MEFLDKTGVQTLWNKCKDTFEPKKGTSQSLATTLQDGTKLDAETENIQPITEEMIAKAASVEIKQFNFKSGENKTVKFGVIAQEVEKEGLENLVSVNGETGLRSVDYTSLLCLKIKALEDKLEKMERELQELKNR